MVIGTSADYPPFEYRAPSFTIDGFDAALMREIARRLGVSVELHDYAFDGLLDGVQLGQIDGAIAAISVTDERSQQVDFSRTYRLTCRSASAATIRSAAASKGSLPVLRIRS
jgi:polar amino acid transport system substrate-binding protein